MDIHPSGELIQKLSGKPFFAKRVGIIRDKGYPRSEILATNSLINSQFPVR
jgi:hypothetical protein